MGVIQGLESELGTIYQLSELTINKLSAPEYFTLQTVYYSYAFLQFNFFFVFTPKWEIKILVFTLLCI